MDSKLLKTKSPEGARPPQERAVKTHNDLLQAARTIFARDGFELASVEDIAKAAGKTRGAFYAHFTNKEDVFFAIYERDMEEKKVELSTVIGHLPTLEERVTALCQYISKRATSREATLLQIEFKAYAVRHPRQRKRLAALHAAMAQNFVLKEITEFVPTMEGRACSLALTGALEGMMLNHMFDPEGIGQEQFARMTELILMDELRRAQAAGLTTAPKSS